MNLRKRVPRQYVTDRSPKTCTKKKLIHQKSLEESDEQFEVEEILDKKVVKRRIKYFLKWKGYPKSCNTWVYKSNLNCSALIKQFENNVKKEKEDSKQKALKEDILQKRNDIDIPVKNNLKESKKTHSAYHSSRKNSLEDFIIKDDCKVKHKTKNVESHEYKIAKTKCDDPETKHTVKNVVSNEHKISRRRLEDPETKHTVKNVVSNEHKISRRRHEDSREKYTRKDTELNERELIKKRHCNDSQEKPTRIKNDELKKYEVLKKKQYSDSGTKHASKNVEPNEREIVKKRHNDSGTKHASKNVETNEREIVKKRHNDYGTKHTIKNVEPNEHEIIKRRHDGLSRKKPEVAVSSSRNRQMPKIQNLQYYVKSTNFPKKRKNGMLSVMRVSFQGTDVLKGLERFVEAGIATGPLPDYLYDKPIKTGATEFQFTV